MKRRGGRKSNRQPDPHDEMDGTANFDNEDMEMREDWVDKELSDLTVPVTVGDEIFYPTADFEVDIDENDIFPTREPDDFNPWMEMN